MIRFLADASLHDAIVNGCRRREPAIDFLSAHEARLEGVPDPEVLAFATQPNRILVTCKSELFRDTGLSQHGVGCVPGQDLLVYRKTPLRDRAVPDFVVSSAGSVKVTPVRAENLLHRRRVTGH